MNKYMSLARDENGQVFFKKPLKGSNSYYQEAIVKIINTLEPLFDKAKETSEFEFIFTILGIHSLHDAGWDAFETLEDIFESYSQAKSKIQYIGDARAHFTLFLYGIILESSEIYDKLANLLNVIEGKRYTANYFNQSSKPLDKINHLKSRGKKLGYDFSFFDEFFDNQLRNAVFHADYTLYEREVRIFHPIHVYTENDILKKINWAQAYFEVFQKLVTNHKKSYVETKEIPVHANFARYKEEKALVILRDNDGVIGLRSTNEPQGFPRWWVARTLFGEDKKINAGLVWMPKSYTSIINKLLKLLPSPVRPPIVRAIKRYEKQQI